MPRGCGDMTVGCYPAAVAFAGRWLRVWPVPGRLSPAAGLPVARRRSPVAAVAGRSRRVAFLRVGRSPRHGGGISARKRSAGCKMPEHSPWRTDIRRISTPQVLISRMRRAGGAVLGVLHRGCGEARATSMSPGRVRRPAVEPCRRSGAVCGEGIRRPAARDRCPRPGRTTPPTARHPRTEPQSRHGRCSRPSHQPAAR